MCGINILFCKNDHQYEVHFNRMLQATAHRGPDATQREIIPLQTHKIYIGANRLKIMDLTDQANQPMLSTDGNFVLLFNGEIYNYYELRNKLLELKIRFHTRSDTEVVLHWLAHKGLKGLANLEGMFALAFIDLAENILLLARDRHGMKPLYYCQHHGNFLISSQIKSLLASGLVKKELNSKQVNHYLHFKFARLPETFINGIFSVLPGQYLSYDLKSGQITQGTIHHCNHKSVTIPNVNYIHQLLEDSLFKHLHADVPIGLLLSGGVDSTLLLAIAQKNGISMPSFSIVNKKADVRYGTKDYKYARLAAKQYGSAHEVLEIEKIRAEDFFQYINNVDQPIADSGALMTHMISGKARPYIKILISGAGADEYFAGYNRHLAIQQYSKYQPLFHRTSGLTKILSGMIPNLKIGTRRKIRLYQKLFQSISDDPKTTYLNMLQISDWDQHLLAPQKNQNDVSESNDIVLWALNHDRRNYLPNDVLMLSDSMSMGNSIEMRMPFLDDPLVNYMQNIPGRELLKHGKKWILKVILNQHGGKIFTTRSKEGFGLPLTQWLNKNEHAYLWQLFEDKDHPIFELIDWNTFIKLKFAQQTNKSDHCQALWSVIVLGHWINTVLD